MAATENFALPLPQMGEPADIRVLNRGTEEIDGIMNGNRTMFAPAWVDTETYHVGSRVVYLGEYYVCKADNVTGAWDSTKWDHKTVGEDIEESTGGASALADLDDVEITSPTDGQALLYDDSDDKWKNGTLPDPSVTKTATGNPIEINDGADAPLVKCVTQITGYQEGTGTPSPDNVRPIVAYTEGEIEVRGKNQLTPPTNDTVNGVTLVNNSDGSFTLTGTARGNAYFDFFAGNFDSTEYAGKVIYFTTSQQVVGLNIRISRANRVEIQQAEQGGKLTIQDNGSGLYVALRVAINTPIPTGGVVIKAMIIDADDSDEFEPYTSTTHTTTFPSAIYRGSEDCVKGEVTTEWGMIASYAGETLPGEWISDRDEYVPGTTPTTGAQVAYALSTPTTSSVTPTNLPIKSLSGYTHIESSTGEMEIEYITKGEQAIVDLIDKSDHIYSTQEQAVGTWVDGSTVYEKTYELNIALTINAQSWGTTSIDISDIAKFIGAAEVINSGGMGYYCFIDQSNSYMQLYNARQDAAIGVKYITIRYTKSSSNNRSLSKGGGEQEVKEEPTEETKEENENNEAER